MILSDTSIMNEIEKGNIIVNPFNEANLNPCSIDLTLAPEYKIYDNDILDVREEQPTWAFTVGEEGVILYPGKVYLFRCNETIGCKGNIRGKVEGKSSLGRLGLFVHVTAGFIDTGFVGSLVLEFVPIQTIRVYPNMKVCQIEFARVEGKIRETYDQKKDSKYHGQTGVQESKYHLNFKQ